MIAVLLCAGYATRMYPLTEHVPKPLLPVGGTTVLDRLIGQITCLDGISAIHIVTNARFIGTFDQWLLTAPSRDIIVLHNDGSTDNDHRLGALADLMLVLNAVPHPSRILVAAGDNIFRFDLAPLWDSFLGGTDHCVIGLHEPDVAKLRKTGVLETSKDGMVVRMHEKPAAPPSPLACPPLYFFLPALWKELAAYLADPRHNHDAPGWFIEHLCRHARVRALEPASGSRIDIGCIEDYQRACAMFSTENLNTT